MHNRFPIFVAGFLLSVCGCAMRGNVEVLEAELRRQEDQLHSYQLELEQTSSDLMVARREVETLRTQLASRGDSPILPEQARSLFRVTGVRVNKFLTGGLDRDARAGDELINIVLTPEDEHGEPVKTPGALELEVIDPSLPETSRVLGQWDFSAEEVARAWQSGLTSGFQFRLPWQMQPSSEAAILNVRMTTVDGREFGTSAEVRVTPAPEMVAQRKSRGPLNFTQPTVPPAPETLPTIAGEERRTKAKPSHHLDATNPRRLERVETMPPDQETELFPVGQNLPEENANTPHSDVDAALLKTPMETSEFDLGEHEWRSLTKQDDLPGRP